LDSCVCHDFRGEEVLRSSHKAVSAKQNAFLKNDDALMYGLMAPSLIIVILVSIVPLAYTFILSFQNYFLTKPNLAHFSGVNNYISLFGDPVIRQSIITTIVYTISTVTISIVIGILLALLVDSVPIGKSFYRIILFAPMMLCSVVLGVIWRFLYNNELGIINYFISLMGFERINFLGKALNAMISLVIADVWQWASYTFILVLAALEAMNPEPVEAARIDGASAWHIFWLIKLPSIFPVIEVAAVFRSIWSFRGFDLIYALTKGGPGTSTQTMALEIYRQAFTQYNIGLSSAIAVVMFILLIFLSLGILHRTMNQSKGELVE
jgi:multiple sugar transport system permease protein